MIKSYYYVFLLAVFLTGCSMFVKPSVQKITRNEVKSHEVQGNRVVCILFKDSRFKSEVVELLTNSLIARDYTVITDDVKMAKFYKSSDYGAIVYMADYWAWHVPWHAKNYYRKNNEASNIIFVVTSGGPDVEIHRPFDAITSVSKPNEVERVSQSAMERLDSVLR